METSVDTDVGCPYGIQALRIKAAKHELVAQSYAELAEGSSRVYLVGQKVLDNLMEEESKANAIGDALLFCEKCRGMPQHAVADKPPCPIAQLAISNFFE